MNKAFTMIELVFVLVIIGILSAVIIPSVKTNSLQEAAIQLVSHIRYTQHLALTDDTYKKTDDEWYKKRWQLVFYKGKAADYKIAYTIFSDTAGSSTGNPQETEIAINPQNINQIMTGGYSGANALNIRKVQFIGMPELNIGKKYYVKSKKLYGGCSGSRISFDYLGRPLKGDHDTMTSPYKAAKQRLITKDCKIALKSENEKVIIVIKAETGFVKILM